MARNRNSDAEREAAAVAKRERKAALKARNVARSWANNYYTLHEGKGLL